MRCMGRGDIQLFQPLQIVDEAGLSLQGYLDLQPRQPASLRWRQRPDRLEAWPGHAGSLPWPNVQVGSNEDMIE